MAERDDGPPPGSREAVAAGCRCAVLDNHRGRGYRGQEGIYVISGDCPLHGFEDELMALADGRGEHS